MCPKELAGKTLLTFSLDDGLSIEDVCGDLEYVRSSVKKLANTLVASGERKFANEIDVDKEIAKIKPTKGKTLGLIIDEVTKPMFEPNEKLSKLAIALIYDDFSETEDLSLPEKGVTLVKEIKKRMKLKGEKSADKGVFEIVS